MTSAGIHSRYHQSCEIVRRHLRPLMDRLFDPDAETPPLDEGLALEFVAESTLGQLHRFFGFPGPTWSETPLRELLASEAVSHHGPFRIDAGTTSDLVRLTVEAEPAPEPAPECTPEPVPAGTP